MKYRLFFYLIYSVLILSIGYVLFYKVISPGKLENVLFLLLSVILQYLLSSVCFKISNWRLIAITILFWVLSIIVGLIVLVHFAFDKKRVPADLYGLIAFLLTMVFCYEILAMVMKKMKR